MLNYIEFELTTLWYWVKSFFVKPKQVHDPIKDILETKVNAAVKEAIEAYNKLKGKPNGS